MFPSKVISFASEATAGMCFGKKCRTSSGAFGHGLLLLTPCTFGFANPDGIVHLRSSTKTNLAQVEDAKRSKVFTNILQILMQSRAQAKKWNYQIWSGRSKSWQFFQQTNSSRPLSRSDLLSSLLQLSISPPWCSSHSEYKWEGLWILSTKWNTKVSWEQTYYSFPAFLWFAVWSCSVVPFEFPSCGMLCYLGSTLAYLTYPPYSTKPSRTQNSKNM